MKKLEQRVECAASIFIKCHSVFGEDILFAVSGGKLLFSVLKSLILSN